MVTEKCEREWRAIVRKHNIGEDWATNLRCVHAPSIEAFEEAARRILFRITNAVADGRKLLDGGEPKAPEIGIVVHSSSAALKWLLEQTAQTLGNPLVEAFKYPRRRQGDLSGVVAWLSNALRQVPRPTVEAILEKRGAGIVRCAG